MAQPIEFAQLLAKEKAAAHQTEIAIKFTSASDVYNGMLRRPQDGGARIMLFDSRPYPRVQLGKLRGAHVIGENSGEVRVRGEDGSPEPFQCTGDIIAIVYDDESSKQSGCSDGLADCMRGVARCGAQKVFAMSGGYASFAQQYPFMCCGTEMPVQYDAAQIWPAEILPSRLYLTRSSCVNEAVCAAVGAGHVIHIGPDDAECGGVPHIHLEADNSADAYMPLLEALEAFNQTSGPVLLCCDDGTTMSATVAVACVMMFARLSHMQALAYVMKRKRDVAPMNNNFQFQELEKQLASSSLQVAAPAEK